MSSPGASQHPLRCATMHVGRAAAMKLHDISYAIEGLDVVALQEIDLNVVGAPSFVAFWARKGYRTVFGGALNGFYKVAILSRLALQCVQLELQEAPRVAAVTVGTFEPMLFATVYGFANDAPRTRPLVRELVSQLHGTGHPWVLLGDYNLEAEDLEEIFATGLAHCLDEPFECEGLPSTRSPGQRRIDFGIAYARHATRLFVMALLTTYLWRTTSRAGPRCSHMLALSVQWFSLRRSFRNRKCLPAGFGGP